MSFLSWGCKFITHIHSFVISHVSQLGWELTYSHFVGTKSNLIIIHQGTHGRVVLGMFAHHPLSKPLAKFLETQSVIKLLPFIKQAKWYRSLDQDIQG